MNVRPSFLASLLLGTAVLFCSEKISAASDSAEKARVTQVIRDVKLLRAQSSPEPATVNEKVGENTSVRTGDDSRSELTFVDLTITRLGANTIFSFNKAGRSVQLNGGEMLLRVPKDSGGAHMTTEACSVAITGTTVTLKATRSGRNKLTVLEGGARLSLRKYPRESQYVRAGQMLDVPAGATKLPPPQDIDVDQIMNNDPLITDFPPLPSRNLIYTSQNPHIYQGQPVNNAMTPPGPIFGRGPIVPNLFPLAPYPPNSNNPPGTPTRTTTTKTGVATNANNQPAGNQLGNSRLANIKSQPKPTPTPTPRKKKTLNNPKP